MILLKYPTIISSNNANERVWMVLTGLDEVFRNFDVLLTVHLAINQLDAQNLIL